MSGNEMKNAEMERAGIFVGLTPELMAEEARIRETNAYEEHLKAMSNLAPENRSIVSRRAALDCRIEVGDILLPPLPQLSSQPPKQSPLEVQVGGNYYRKMKIQPVEFITANDIGFLEGCVIKRICRYEAKNGVQDLLKAKHEIDLLIASKYPEYDE